MKPAATTKLRLVLFGDIHIGQELADLHSADPAIPFGAASDLLTNADLVYANIESVFYRGPLRPHRSVHLWSPTESAGAVRGLKLDVAGFANNHAMDFGPDAMMRSVNLLKAQGIACIGAGWTASEARRGCVIDRHGWKVGFLAYTSSIYHVRSIVAGRWKAGCAPMQERAMQSDILRLRHEVDVLCIALHWGYEFMHVPHPRQRALARQLIEWGADVIVGTHPHVVQGYEVIQGRPVFYSLGNFVFADYRKITGERHTWQDANHESIAGMVDIMGDPSRPAYTASVHPLQFRFPAVHVLKGCELRQFEENLAQWNKALTDTPGADPLVEDMLSEVDRRDQAWRRGRIRRILRQIAVERAYAILGRHRVATLKAWLALRGGPFVRKG